jgi:hypothetical protein
VIGFSHSTGKPASSAAIVNDRRRREVHRQVRPRHGDVHDRGGAGRVGELDGVGADRHRPAPLRERLLRRPAVEIGQADELGIRRPVDGADPRPAHRARTDEHQADRLAHECATRSSAFNAPR